MDAALVADTAYYAACALCSPLPVLSRQSRALLDAEMQLQRLRLQCIDHVHLALYHRVADIASPSTTGYADLLAWLTAQAALSVPDERQLRVQCRLVDVPALSCRLPVVEELLTSLLRSVGLPPQRWSLTLSPTYLPPPPSLRCPQSASDAKSGPLSPRSALSLERLHCSVGGVQLLVGADGRVRVDNGLNHRLDTALQQLLPDVRRMLWGEADVESRGVWRMAEQRMGRRGRTVTGTRAGDRVQPSQSLTGGQPDVHRPLTLQRVDTGAGPAWERGGRGGEQKKEEWKVEPTAASGEGEADGGGSPWVREEKGSAEDDEEGREAALICSSKSTSR